jgi:hypothetical protein
MKPLTLFFVLALSASVASAQWVQISAPGGQVWSFAVSGTNLFAATSHGVFLSTNTGSSWKEVNSGMPYEKEVRALVLCGTRLFAATTGGVGAYLSTDSGASWVPASTGLPVFSSSSSHLLCFCR